MKRLKSILPYLGIVLLSGCDAAAEISFDNEQVVELAAQGFVSPACESFSGADVVFRFNLMTSLDARLEPGHRLAGMEAPILPGKTFSGTNIVFGESWLFEVGADGKDVACTTSESCGLGASCLSISQMGLGEYYYAPGSYCVISVSPVVVGEPTFTHYREAPVEAEGVYSQNMQGRTIGFMYDNSATLDGSQVDGAANDAVATDPWQYRRVGLIQFFDALTREGTAGSFELSAHFANGTGESGVYAASEKWFKSLAQWRAGVMDKFPTPSGASPIWEAVVSSLSMMIDTANAAYSRTMVVFTDGAPNEGSAEARIEFSKKLESSTNLSLSWLDYTPEGVGPTYEYAQSVSKQCGTYYHFHAASQIPSIMRRLALSTESWWSAGVSLGTTLESGRIYRLATRVVVSAGDGAASFAAQRRLDHQVVLDDRFLVVR